MKGWELVRARFSTQSGCKMRTHSCLHHQYYQLCKIIIDIRRKTTLPRFNPRGIVVPVFDSLVCDTGHTACFWPMPVRLKVLSGSAQERIWPVYRAVGECPPLAHSFHTGTGSEGSDSAVGQWPQFAHCSRPLCRARTSANAAQACRLGFDLCSARILDR